eukprot:3814564-Amphidinium_carterae.1
MQRARAAGWGENAAAGSGRSSHFVPRGEGSGRLHGGEGHWLGWFWGVPGPQRAGRGGWGDGGPGRRRTGVQRGSCGGGDGSLRGRPAAEAGRVRVE